MAFEFLVDYLLFSGFSVASGRKHRNQAILKKSVESESSCFHLA
jgi:hypothetical protein